MPSPARRRWGSRPQTSLGLLAPVLPSSHLRLRSSGRQNWCSWTCSSQSYSLKGNGSWPRGRWFQIGACHTLFQKSRAPVGRIASKVVVMTSVKRRRLRSAELPVALLLQSQNRITERPSQTKMGPHTLESKRKKGISAHPIRVETYSPRGGHCLHSPEFDQCAPSSLCARDCRATRRWVASRVNQPVGLPGIKEQEADINDSDPRGREASSEGQHAFIHSAKRVEDVS